MNKRTLISILLMLLAGVWIANAVDSRLKPRFQLPSSEDIVAVALKVMSREFPSVSVSDLQLRLIEYLRSDTNMTGRYKVTFSFTNTSQNISQEFPLSAGETRYLKYVVTFSESDLSSGKALRVPGTVVGGHEEVGIRRTKVTIPGHDLKSVMQRKYTGEFAVKGIPTIIENARDALQGEHNVEALSFRQLEYLWIRGGEAFGGREVLYVSFWKKGENIETVSNGTIQIEGPVVDVRIEQGDRKTSPKIYKGILKVSVIVGRTNESYHSLE